MTTGDERALTAVQAVRRILEPLSFGARMRVLARLLHAYSDDVSCEPPPLIETRDIPASMRDLTARQSRVLAWIRGFVETNGIAPTLREIGLGCGIGSTNGVSDHLKRIAAKGYISLRNDRARGIVLHEGRAS